MADLRRISLLAALIAGFLTILVPGASGQSAWDQKRHLDSRISGLQAQIDQAKEQEGVLTSEIEAASSRIEALEDKIAVLTDRLTKLENDLAALRRRLDQLEELYDEQTAQLIRLRKQLAIAQARLEARLVELYQSAETDELGIILGVQTLGEMIEQIDYITEIGRQDRSIVDEVTQLKIETRVARQKTAATKKKVAAATAALAAKTAAERAAQQSLLSQQASLDALRDGKQSLLGDVREDRKQAEENLAALEAASAALTGQLQGGGSSSSGSGPSTVSSSGLIWPVSGVLTSGYGPRWGRMHTGIDISAPGGTPVSAAAGGTVIIAGWMGGYGNLIVVDHGGGLATAYAHLSAIYVGGGAVSQGQSIGAVGSTGNSTGNHLHFEVRVNGSPVDPMGYL